MINPKVKLTFLGSGSAFTVGDNNYQSNLLLEDLTTKKKLLIDCGTDIRWSLYANGYTFRDIDAVFISHIHADHTGGLEFLALSRFFNGCVNLDLYLAQSIKDPLWTTLQAGLSTMDSSPTALSTYFNIKEIDKTQIFQWQNHIFELEPTIHVVDNGTNLPCYGLKFKINNNQIYFTADSRFLYKSKRSIYENSTVIFHDCETSQQHSGVHSHYVDLLSLPEHIRKKTWLYHYNPGSKQQPQQDKFKGFVGMGQSFLF